MRSMTGEEVIKVLRSITHLTLCGHSKHDAELEVRFDNNDEVFTPIEFLPETFTRELLLLIQQAMEGSD